MQKIAMCFNMLYVWLCQIVYYILYFDGYGDKNFNSKKYLIVIAFLNHAIMLDTVTNFIYTWEFLEVILAELKVGKTKKILEWYKYLSIFVSPFISYAFYISTNVLEVNYYHDFFNI